MALIIHNFDNPQELYNEFDMLFTGKKPEAENSCRWRFLQNAEQDRDFHGMYLSEANRYRYGYAPYAEMAQRLVDVLTPIIATRKVNTYDDQDGVEIDMERFMEGDERCLIKKVKKAGSKLRGAVKIYINVTENCMVTQQQMLWKTFTAVKLTDAIENAGYRTEIIVCICEKNVNTKATRDFYRIQVAVKRPEEPLDISAVAWFVSPVFFRTFGFGMIAMGIPNCAMNYGFPDVIREVEEDAIRIETGMCLSEQAANEFLTNNNPLTAKQEVPV